MCDRLATAYAKHVPDIPVRLLYDQDIAEACEAHLTGSDEKLQDTKFGRKHGSQQVAIASHLRTMGLLDKKLCYIEFGAGKGGLSHCLAAATEDKAWHLLIDRETRRRKDDRLHRRQGYSRRRVDIRHLVLSGLKEELGERDIVAVGKHLCGVATDLTLRCLEKASSDGLEVRGLGVALCCHHCCTWRSYVGKTFLEDLGFNEKDFRLLVKLSSWATSGMEEASKNEAKSKVEAEAEANVETKLAANAGLEQVEECAEQKRKREIGLFAKRLIDMGRISFVRSQGLEGRLVQYSEGGNGVGSIENILLLVERPPAPSAPPSAVGVAVAKYMTL